MPEIAVARTTRYVTHLVTLDAQGQPERLVCQPNRALPRATRLEPGIAVGAVVCNRCCGANR